MGQEKKEVLCPECGHPMARGRLYSPVERGIYWLPDTVGAGDMGGWIVTGPRIQAVGGVVLYRLAEQI